MGRIENIAIFRESRTLWETEPALASATAEAVASTRVFPEGMALESFRGSRRFSEPMELEVTKKRSYEAASAYGEGPVCVLNFASAANPGGGVEKGSTAQEESLCRSSNLYPCLNTRQNWDAFYTPHRRAADPLHNDDCIYTRGVTVFRSDDGSDRLLPPEKRFTVDVLTCAAPNLRLMEPSDISEEELSRLITKRTRRILDLACLMGVRVLILGAFGCGAFANPPRLVARAMRKALEDYKYAFGKVEFAVYCSPGREENYLAFRDEFAR